MDDDTQKTDTSTLTSDIERNDQFYIRRDGKMLRVTFDQLVDAVDLRIGARNSTGGRDRDREEIDRSSRTADRLRA